MSGVGHYLPASAPWNLLVTPPLGMSTGPDFEYQGWGILVPWIECGGWKGWCKDLEWLDTGCAWEGTGVHHPQGDYASA